MSNASRTPVHDRNRDRELGRPRTFTDEDAFAATQRVLLREGAQGVTLAAVARELACTGQALNARFGSRKGLLSAYAEWATEQQLDRFRQVRVKQTSPLRTLRARFELPLEGREDEVSGAGAHLHLLSFLAEARREPEFAARYLRRISAFEQEIATLIREAVAHGELAPEIDPDETAHLLVAALTGAATLWSIAAQGSVLDEGLRVLDRILVPYLVPQLHPAGNPEAD